MKEQLSAFLTALHFLTCIRFGKGGRNASFPESVVYFPLVGLFLGLVISVVWALLSYFAVPDPARAGVILAVIVILGGGLHLDGFIDSMDALLSGKEREQKLTIMKDSHVGAHGLTAAVVLLILKYSLLQSLPVSDIFLMGLNFSPALLVMPLLGRWAMVLALTCYPYARNRGLGSLFNAGGGRKALIVSTLITMLILGFVLGFAGMVLLLLVYLAAVAWCRWVTGQLGGMTGDTYGALSEIIEVFVLAVIFILI